MELLSYMNYIISVIFAACYFHQLIYVIVRLVKKQKKFKAVKLSKFVVLIAARNEETVIAQLIESIKAQKYPSNMLDIYVVADNCTDSTAEIARNAGATVYERDNKVLVGKGYALNYILSIIKTEKADIHYDGYFVFDADNLLDSRYISEMNKVFTNGYEVVTGYRNAKNYGDNWISSSYGLWFLRESEYLNHPRFQMGISCAISGTGFLFSDELIEKNGGWNYFLLTEDLEFTADRLIKDQKIGYCHSAILYDEQPTGFIQSIQQRSRWIKGIIQVVSKYGKGLAKGIVKDGRFACYDMLMGIIPVAFLTITGFLINAALFGYGLIFNREQLPLFFTSICTSIINAYLTMYAIGLLTTITEWKKISCKNSKKIIYTFFFPLFTFSFAIAMVIAMFTNVEWHPIKHTSALSITDLGKTYRK